jgi:hypothetical protein
LERLLKTGGEGTRRMMIERTNTRYGRETSDKVGRDINLLNLVKDFLFILKGQCTNRLR